MTPWKKALLSWRDRPITAKFRIGIGLLVCLMLVIATTGIFSLLLVRRASDAIRVNTEIQRLILEMDRDMETARNLHADFFLYYPRIGLHKAHQDYAQTSVRKTARVVAASQALKEMINAPRASPAFLESESDLNLYLSSARRFADTSIKSFELATQLAAPGKGLEEKIETAVDELKRLTDPFRDLSDQAHQIEDFVHQYRMKLERPLMQSAFNLIFDLRQRIASLSLDGTTKEKIESALQKIEGHADRILAIHAAIAMKFKDFILQEQAARAVSDKFATLANREVLKARNRIVLARNLTIGILCAVTLSGLIAAAGIARILDVYITRRITALTGVTANLRKGNLDLLADEKSQDELGHLGRTFNFMAARIKSLVDYLEQEVNDRTAELSRANHELEQEIRERRQAEALLRQKEAFLDRVIDQSPFATWISDANGTLEKANKALKKALNLSDEQLVGKYNILEDPLVQRQNLVPLVRTVFEEGKTIRFNCEWDGNDIPGKDFKGSASVSIDATMFPVFNAEGRLINAVLSWIDVSEKKRIESEKQLLEQQLRQAQKMEAIGTLAGGVAHDFNNILGIMIGNAELALDDMPEDDPVRENLEEILTAGLRAKEVIRQLLSYSRKTAQDQHPHDLGRLVRESLNLLRSSIPSSIKILEHIPGEKLLINADATQIHQVIINLSANAAHAMEEKGGVLNIQVTGFDRKTQPDEMYKDLAPGSYVVLRVSDTGTGMSQTVLEKIFDPYYTTKEFGKGTGLGLSVVHGILKSHHAVLHVDSRSGKGTTFSIFFPRLSGSAEETTDPPEASLPRGTGNLMFVDDESAMVMMMTTRLEKLGYRVKGETHPADAIETFKSSPGEVDLVITDMTMPQMDGAELTTRLKAIRPDIPVIICTGHSANLNDRRARELGITAWIMKPVSMAELSVKIHEVMGRRPVPPSL